MSEEYEDEVNAAEEFLEIFRENDRRKILVHKFVSGYKRGYSLGKKHLKWLDSGELERIRELNGDTDYACGNVVSQPLLEAIKVMEAAESRMSENKHEDTAWFLGVALGWFLASMRFGVASDQFRIYGKSRASSLVKERVERVVAQLKGMNKSIKHEFLTNTINRIAKKRANRLSSDQQKLLAEIAVMFK